MGSNSRLKQARSIDIPMLRRFLPLLIIGFALLIAAALIATKPKAKPVEVTEKAWLVSVEQAQPASLSPSVTLYGKLESLWPAQLTAGIAADVIEVAVIEGDHFSRGDLLVRLDDRDARLALVQREAELGEIEARIDSEHTRHATDLKALPRERSLLALTRAEVRRLSDLVEKKVSAQSPLDTARQAAERQAISLAAREQAVTDHQARLAELEARRSKAVALRDQAALELERCTVIAPFNGRVARVLVAPGRRARVGDGLVEIYDTDAMVIRAQISNSHLPRVRQAMARGLVVSVEGKVDGQPVSASLRSLAGAVDQGSGGVEGLFELKDAGADLQQGRFVKLYLELPPVDGLVALPHEAVYGSDRVYRMDEQNRMRPIRVERVGEMPVGNGLTRVLVRSPELVLGTPVITTQLPNAIDGLLVRLAGERG